MRAAPVIRAAFQGAMRSALSAVRTSIGRSALRATEDRRVLEQVILPAFERRAAGQRVLFVGCAAYTKPYADRFAAHEYWTIDPVPSRRRHGAQRHIVAYLQKLGDHVPEGFFDVIICNGVLGWGLNSPAQADSAFAACHRHLRAEGELVLGWNDVSPRNRVSPGQIPSLQRFRPLVFEPLQTAMLKVSGPNQHVFNFYWK